MAKSPVARSGRQLCQELPGFHLDHSSVTGSRMLGGAIAHPIASQWRWEFHRPVGQKSQADGNCYPARPWLQRGVSSPSQPQGTCAPEGRGEGKTAELAALPGP